MTTREETNPKTGHERTHHDRSDRENNGHDDANISGVLGSMIGLVTAGAQFSVEQMQNAASLVTDPKRAMGRMKDSIDNISHAMAGKHEGKVWEEDTERNRTDTHVHGRKA